MYSSNFSNLCRSIEWNISYRTGVNPIIELKSNKKLKVYTWNQNRILYYLLKIAQVFFAIGYTLWPKQFSGSYNLRDWKFEKNLDSDFRPKVFDNRYVWFRIKGQSISKCPFGVIVSTKKTTKNFEGFLPQPLKRDQIKKMRALYNSN